MDVFLTANSVPEENYECGVAPAFPLVFAPPPAYRRNPVTQQTIEPSFKLARFTCPSCNQLSDQAWFNTYANLIQNAEGVPLRIQGADLERLYHNPQFPPEVREQKLEYWTRVNNGEVFLDRWAPIHSDTFVAGLEVSACHACMKAAIWFGGEMVYPQQDNKE